MANALALVTGASSGIGYELARELASRGYDVVIASAGERLQGAADDLRALGTEITEVRQDLATRRGVDALWQVVEANGSMKPLLGRIENGEIDPSHIISHRIALEDAPRMYEIWRDKKDNVTKIVIDPWAEKQAA